MYVIKCINSSKNRWYLLNNTPPGIYTLSTSVISSSVELICHHVFKQVASLAQGCVIVMPVCVASVGRLCGLLCNASVGLLCGLLCTG